MFRRGQEFLTYFAVNKLIGDQLFTEILKERFKDLGLGKIKRGEWLLQDHHTGRILDLAKPWGSLVRVGRLDHGICIC
jgi:hypothetical protein